jgi:hydrogenase maturation protein HypF
VILENKTGGLMLAPSVSNGFGTTGVMLPYMPFHHLLFEKIRTPAIVLTSGNVSDEPVIIGNDAAISRLSGVADAFLIYDRDIHNRADDSVLFLANGRERMIRRSRGFTPSPVEANQDVDGIFAAGAELVNCFCMGKGTQAIVSQHIGDLKNLETLDFYTESFRRFSRMFRLNTSLVAADLHPDYLSTRFATGLAESKGIPLVGVQHHHAHIASCMAEHGLDERVIGISMDGTGYGTDGHTWGFEVFSCDLTGFERLSHLDYVPQPGGDKVSNEPWRMAVAYLFQYAPDLLDDPRLFINQKVNPDSLRKVRIALEHRINTPLTSSAGRLFDAVAAITGISPFATFHAEAPMRLERAIDPSERGAYDFIIDQTIGPGPMIRQVTLDAVNGISPGIISARFHQTVVQMMVQSALNARNRTGLETIVLSGGTFQNRYILGASELALSAHDFRVFSPGRIPANDGGIALGQLVVAASLRESGKLQNL